MQYEGRVTTLRDILTNPQLTPEKRREIYGVRGSFTDGNQTVERHIDRVIIDGNIFTDYKAFSFLLEKSYVKEPVRSGDGSIGNLNSYATFLTPHLKIDFSMMSIDSYRAIMNLIYTKNEFTVTCYDVVKNKDTTNKMYFATEEMPKLWTITDALNGNEEAIELLGVQDYTVEMIGTNASLSTVEILYYYNGVLVSNQQITSGAEVIIGYDLNPTGGERFEGKWISTDGTIYFNGDALTLKDNLVLHAVTIPVNEYTLSFAYGNGNELYSQTTGAVSSITIKKGETLSTAISKANITLENGQKFVFPTNGTGSKSIIYKDKPIIPYEFKGWYWTTEPNENTKVTENSTFDYNFNRVIYQIYSPKTYKIEFITNDNNISFSTISVPYGQYVALPSPRKTDYSFGGWYTTSNFEKETQFSGTMPPENLKLYAKWVKNS